MKRVAPFRVLVSSLGVLLSLSALAQNRAVAPPARAEGGPESHELANESHPEKDLVAAGQVTEEELSRLAAAGFRTVIDLRTEAENRGFDEPAVVAAAGMRYVSLPISPQTLGPETFSRFFELLETVERPVLVHCATSNRVGALYAGYLGARKEMSIEDAIRRGRQAGLKSEELVQLVRGFLLPYVRP